MAHHPPDAPQTASSTDSSEPAEPSPLDDKDFWHRQLAAAKVRWKKFHDQGEKVVKAFLDERESSALDDRKWNLFWSSTVTLRALLYGRPPQANVGRRHADAKDDTARVAALISERALNEEVGADGGFAEALGLALDDRLLVGLGCARVRYEVKFLDVPEVPALTGQCRACLGDGSGRGPMGEEGPGPCPQCGGTGSVELAPAVPAKQIKVNESVPVDFVHWRDVLWSASRYWGEVWWLGIRTLMSREDLIDRFGEKLGKDIPLNAVPDRKRGREEDPEARAEVWEIWCKRDRKTRWISDGYPAILDTVEDPLGLRGFWPMPKPMAANTTTRAFLPKADYTFAQDLYREVNSLTARITLLEEAVKVVGIYDKTAGVAVERLLSDAAENELIPVDDWAMHAEKGGLRGRIEFLPLEQIIDAMTALRGYRREAVEALYQVTGQSDIMRGQATTSDVTATEQMIKARFGGVRVQATQDDFARYASSIHALRHEVMCTHFEPARLLALSNIERTPDAPLAEAALQLLQDKHSDFRVEVKSEQLSMADFAALQNERQSFLTGLSGFLTAMAPLIQQQPAATPFLMELLQWTLSGFRGASEAEGIIDRAIEAAKSAPPAAQGAPLDPKVMVQQIKGQQDIAKIRAQLDADVALEQAQVAADASREQAQTEANVREAAGRAAVSRAARAPLAGLVVPKPPTGPGGSV